MQCEIWAIRNRKTIDKAKSKLENETWINVGIHLCVPHNKVFTKKNTVKKWDSANRIKATLDAIAKIIEIDDAHFFINNTTKVVCDEKPHTIITLEPTIIKSKQQLMMDLK